MTSETRSRNATPITMANERKRSRIKPQIPRTRLGARPPMMVSRCSPEAVREDA